MTSLAQRVLYRASLEAKCLGYRVATPLLNGKDRFTCPICSFEGPFLTVSSDAGPRVHALCPSCRSFERHRLQYLVVKEVIGLRKVRAETCLQFAPDPLSPILKGIYRNYVAADLDARNGLKMDMRSIPLPNESVDLVFASHVLEHIREDEEAISEVARVLKPGGFAILPVPIVCERTIEYPHAMPNEFFHVRAPGLDYCRRYERHFRKVKVFTSDDFAPVCQTHIFEDRTAFPTREIPYRTGMSG